MSTQLTLKDFETIYGGAAVSAKAMSLKRKNKKLKK